MMRKAILLMLMLGLSVTVTAAQIQIDKSRPAKASGEVDIELAFGSVKVIGWDREEVSVTGRLAPGAEGLDFETHDEDGIWIEVEVPDSWFYESDDDSEFQSHLEIHVPATSSLEIETVNASVTISGMWGLVEVETVNGAVVVEGSPTGVDVETVTGGIQVTAAGAPMDLESISGDITARGVRRAVSISTLSGVIDVQGTDLEEVEIESTAGDVRLEGSLVAEGEIEVETFSGQVHLLFPREVAARFEFVTFGGQIDNALGPRPRRNGRFNPYQELKFATGLNEFEISVETYNGNITLGLSGDSGTATH